MNNQSVAVANATKRTLADTEKIGNVKCGDVSGAGDLAKSDHEAGISDVLPSGADFPQPKGIVNVASFSGNESTISNKK
jgi:hypothetical protein